MRLHCLRSILLIPLGVFASISIFAQDPSLDASPLPTSPSPPTRSNFTPTEQIAARKLSSRSEQELAQLERIRQERELQDAILKWAQGRFWTIAAVGLLIGFFGVRALVRELIAGELKEAMRVIATAQAASDQAREATKRVQAEAEEYEDAVEKLRKTATDVQSELTSLRGIIDAESANARKAAEIGVGGLQRQLDALAATVSELSPPAKRGDDVIARQSEIKQHAAAEQDEFAQRSRYTIRINSNKDHSNLVTALTARGYKIVTNPMKFRGIPPNIILHGPAAGPVLDEISRIIAEQVGRQPSVAAFPFKGIQADDTTFYYIPEGSGPPQR